MVRGSWSLCAVLCFVLAGTAMAGGAGLLIYVQPAELAWADTNLAARLQARLALKSFQQITIVSAQDSSFPGVNASQENLMAWGRGRDGTGLLVVSITDERLERRKSFHVPLVFHKWETMGVIEGRYRLFDLQRLRMTAAEPFSIEQHGPRVFQGTMDDNIDDPDIHLRAPDKVQFFSRLEDQLIERLVERAQPLTGKHDREAYAQKTKGK
ncbi:MAG: hypothetical protein AB1644_05510 [Candidatus Zixiibacteriota bacterium]